MATVLVGKKPTANYIMAVLTLLNKGEKEIELKARGKAISKAVDVATTVMSLLPEIKVEKIETGTDEIQTEDGRRIGVSTITILLKKE